jgi:hypothetical protein
MNAETLEKRPKKESGKTADGQKLLKPSMLK